MSAKRVRRPRECEVAGCEKVNHTGNRLCPMHRERLRRHGSLERVRNNYPEGVRCSHPECVNKSQRRGYCDRHYREHVAAGDLPRVARAPRPPRNVDPLTELFNLVMKRVDVSGVCWEFQGSRPHGYGSIGTSVNGERFNGRAHRVAWEYLVGPIPSGLVLDHLCRNTSCVNPDHLEPVTQQENVRRGYAPAALNARRTHCKRGHEFSGDNLEIQRNGRRVCGTCHRAADVARRGSAA